jgi:hypothetical protein
VEKIAKTCYNLTMTGLIIIVVTFAVLFLLAFFTKRRFGYLGLGLAAGVLLNQLVGGPLGEALQHTGLNVSPLQLKDVSTIVLTILPSVLLLWTGPKHRQKLGRFLTSLFYALITTALILLPITHAFPVEDANVRNVLTLISDVQLPLLTFCIILAIVDILLPNKSIDKSKK